MEVTKMNNEDLLDELLFAYEDMRDYVNKSDWIKWSPEKEKEASNKYSSLREEVINRMNAKNDITQR